MAERIEAFKVDHLDDCASVFMTAFNAEPWNDSYTTKSARKQLAWHLRVPGCLGLVSVKDGIAAFAIGYREPTEVGDVFHLSIFCVRPDARRTGVGSKLLGHLEERLLFWIVFPPICLRHNRHEALNSVALGVVLGPTYTEYYGARV